MRPVHALPIARLSDPDDLARATLRLERCRDRLGPVRSDPCERLDDDDAAAPDDLENGVPAFAVLHEGFPGKVGGKPTPMFAKRQNADGRRGREAFRRAAP